MDKTKMKIALAVLLVVIAVVSFFGITPWATNPEHFEKTIATLDEKKENVMKLTGVATAASVAISAFPGDMASPVAEKFADLSGYFLIILSAIYFEKYMVTMVGYATFKFLVPIGCIVFAVNIFAENETLKKFATKAILFGLALFLVIPLSVKTTTKIEEKYNQMNAINSEIEENSGDSAEVGDAGSIENGESNTGTQAGTAVAGAKANFGFFDNLANGIQNIVNGIKEKANSASEIVRESAQEGVNELEDQLNGMIEAIAILIVTSCVIPILILVFFIWITKIILEVDISVPSIASIRKLRKL